MLADYVHSGILFAIIMAFMVRSTFSRLLSDRADPFAPKFHVYTRSEKIGSPSVMYDLLVKAAKDWPVEGNKDGSYLTFRAKSGLIFMVRLRSLLKCDLLKSGWTLTCRLLLLLLLLPLLCTADQPRGKLWYCIPRPSVLATVRGSSPNLCVFAARRLTSLRALLRLPTRPFVISHALSAIASVPSTAVKGYLLGGSAWLSCARASSPASLSSGR